LHAVVRAAAVHLAEARAALQSREWDDALEFAGRSWRLCHSAEAARLAFMAAGAGGHTETALAWRERVGQAG
jgi:hypothetical protein